MPESVSFRVQAYIRRAKGEPGLTQASSNRICASELIDWALDFLPDEAVTVTSEGDETTTVIDWSEVPDHTRYPKMPGRMVHLGRRS